MGAAERVGEMRCLVGESPVWQPDEAALYWLDIEGRALWRWDPESGRAASWALPEMAGCMAMDADGGWLLAMESGLFLLPALVAGEPAPVPQRVAAVAHPAPGMRFNDGRCDRQGRFWAGTMLRDMSLAAPFGGLYRHTPDHGLERVLDGLIVPNGLAFSPDSRTMYLSDSHPQRRCVWAFDYDVDEGRPRNRRLFAGLPPALGRPDGAAIDVDGGYWICGNDAGLVHRYTPAGRLDRSLAVPVAKPAMCAFGGPRREVLYVTSIRPAGAGPLDGAVFALHPGTQGMDEPRFAG